MHFIGRIIEFLDMKMETPQLYGLFHLSFFALSVFLGVLLVIKLKDPDKKTVRRLLLTVAIVTICLEIYKQFNYTFSYDGTKISADYQWYAFPFQFCSTPMYVCLLAGLIKQDKIHRALCAYLATFSTFGGLCVMFYPGDVFVSTIGINIQTMIHHGVMVTLGIFLLGSGYVKSENKTLLRGTAVFAVCVGLAMIMNEIAHGVGLEETFNMFFISPYEAPSLPVYSIVQQHVAYPFCTMIYIGVFALAAYVILLLAMVIKKCAKKR